MLRVRYVSEERMNYRGLVSPYKPLSYSRLLTGRTVLGHVAVLWEYFGSKPLQDNGLRKNVPKSCYGVCPACVRCVSGGTPRWGLLRGTVKLNRFVPAREIHARRRASCRHVMGSVTPDMTQQLLRDVFGMWPFGAKPRAGTPVLHSVNGAG